MEAQAQRLGDPILPRPNTRSEIPRGPKWDFGLKNGGKETRTPDPLHAMQVLYQLSYAPKRARESRRPAYVRRPVTVPCVAAR